MAIPTTVNNFSTVLELAHAIGDGVLSMRPGSGDLLRQRIAEIGAPDISPDRPIRMIVVGRGTMQANTIVPNAEWTIFEATGLTGDDLTGCDPVEGTADYAYRKNDPVVAAVTADIIKQVTDILADVPSLDSVVLLETDQQVGGVKTLLEPLNHQLSVATTIAKRVLTSSMIGLAAAWREGAFPSLNTDEPDPKKDNLIHYAGWFSDDGTIIVQQGVEIRWWNGAAFPPAAQSEWYREINLIIGGVLYTVRPDGGSISHLTRAIQQLFSADAIVVQNKAGSNYLTISDDGAGTVSIDVYNAGVNTLNFVSEPGVDRIKHGRGLNQASITIDGGTTNVTRPSLIYAEGGLTKWQTGPDVNNTYQIFNVFGGVAFQVLDAAVWGVGLVRATLPVCIGSSVDTGPFLDNTIWVSDTAAGVLRFLILGVVRSIPTDLRSSATLDFPSIAAGGVQDLTLTVTGAALRDEVWVERPAGLPTTIRIEGFVSSANTVTISLYNSSGGAYDPGSLNFLVRVRK